MNTRTAASIIDAGVSLSFHVPVAIPPKSAFPGRRLARDLGGLEFRKQFLQTIQLIKPLMQNVCKPDVNRDNFITRLDHLTRLFSRRV